MKTNIHQQTSKWNVFDEQMQIIKNLGYKFYDPKLFEEEFSISKKEKKILIQ